MKTIQGQLNPHRCLLEIKTTETNEKRATHKITGTQYNKSHKHSNTTHKADQQQS